ncbi:hypothetical protein GCM10023183_10670 [Nibribacter koreensis]|uniref:Uncharacterized protein n=1 Tax=Nibribacter koreensis TaxID=1084519 RepID=A0ABP8FCN7_9BACT
MIGIQLITMLVWWYLCYLRVFKISTQHAIALHEVERAKRTQRPSDKAPILTLYLKNKQKRELILMPTSIDPFSDWLTRQGILVQN